MQPANNGDPQNPDFDAANLEQHLFYDFRNGPPNRRWSFSDSSLPGMPITDMPIPVTTATGAVVAGGTLDASLAASAAAAASSQMPASYYHNLGQLVHNHLHMSNREISDFDCVAAASAAVTSAAPVAPPPVAESVFNPEPAMCRQPINRFHHHPYADHGGLFDNELFGNKARSVSAPTVGNHAANMEMGARRRFRTNFTEHQAMFLEDAFRESHYPDHKSKKDMATCLNIPEDRITVWFQNRRAKWRRKEMREKERSRGDFQASSCSFDYSPFGGPSETQMSVPNIPMMTGFADHQVMPDYPMKTKSPPYQSSPGN
ncbi:unnamed protein product [Caenorhabditis bovis]|uniref:Homeobox domain-containing protein n=1 Tax=Caenorhabditis bovis TaxID=2654633 RepID=A0A8S1EDP7_9PELO|nr:unnamed protein product [Caenorhabditis bovis]